MGALLKPSLTKIVLAPALFALSSYLWRIYVISTISDTFPWGFPLQFYLAWGPCPPGDVCSESNPVFLILDLAFWYSVSALVLSRFGRAGWDREEAKKARKTK
jgi:hypothetical protein